MDRFTRVPEMQGLQEKQFNTTARRKKINNNGIYYTNHGSLSQEWIEERY